MTNVLEPVALPVEDLPPLDGRPPATAVPATGLAVLAVAAGVIHGALAPSHMGEWAVEGVAFLVVAWAQVALGAAFLRRSDTGLLQTAACLNILLIGAWVVSRTTGFPVGPHDGHAEDVGFVDTVAVALEAAIVLAAVVRATGLRVARLAANRLFGLGVPLVAIVATSAALLAPSTRDHAAGAHGEHGDEHGGVVIGKGFEELDNGHHAEIVQYDLDPATQKALDEQLALTREVAIRYPTVGAAEAAGYERAGPYAPGLGVHYVLMNGKGLNFDGVMDRDDILQPLSLQYDGTEPTSKLAGIMYYSFSATEPVGFVGRNDVWHYHEELCLRRGADGAIEAPFGADRQATKEQCDAVGGAMVKQTQWMLHVWTIPGYENPKATGGAFAENNPKLPCSDGTYYKLPPEEWASHPLDICRSAR